MELNLFMITMLPLAMYFSLVFEDLSPKNKHLFKIMSIALLTATAIVGIILDINIYIGG